MAICQGTTPTHQFTLPVELNAIDSVRVVYAQCDKSIFVKTGADVTIEGNVVTTKLTQEDTFAINPDKTVQIQIRVKTLSGDVLKSNTIIVSTDECFDDEVM